MQLPHRPILSSFAIAVLGAVTTVGTAMAAVTFDPATGQGYVGRTDIQAAFGWKDQTLQANAGRVSFYLVQQVSSSWSCLVDGQSQQMLAEVQATSSLASVVTTTTGTHHRSTVTGFSLLGFAAGGGPVGAIVASCGSGSAADVITTETDVLYADFQGQSRSIWSR